MFLFTCNSYMIGCVQIGAQLFLHFQQFRSVVLGFIPLLLDWYTARKLCRLFGSNEYCTVYGGKVLLGFSSELIFDPSEVTGWLKTLKRVI